MTQEERVALRESMLGHDPFIYFKKESIQESIKQPKKVSLKENRIRVPFWVGRNYLSVQRTQPISDSVDLEKEMNGKASVLTESKSETEDEPKATSKTKVEIGKHKVL